MLSFPMACIISENRRAPCFSQTLAISKIGWINPVSLFTNITQTSVLPERLARVLSRSKRSIIPCSSILHEILLTDLEEIVSKTALCSVGKYTIFSISFVYSAVLIT